MNHPTTPELDETVSRRDALDAYLSTQVDDGQRLLCSSSPQCRASMRAGEVMVEGQLSYIGRHYALIQRSRPLRILVVSKQVGGSLESGGGRGFEHVTLDGRAAQVGSAKVGDRPHPRTNHMVGTELALKVLLGRPSDSEPTLELSDGDSPHVFDCMAMANATLCSRAGSDSSGQGSDRMFSNCARHLAATVQILQPTIVLAQGWTKSSAAGRESSVSATVASVLGCRTPVDDPSMVLTDQAWGRVAFISAYHPARHWFTPTMPYWRRLEPLLVAAREAVVG